MKDFGTKGKWTMVEDVYFVTRLRKKILGSFNPILNLTDAKIEKNTAETTDYNKIVQHVIIKYPQHYNKFVQECKESGLINKGEKKLEANG